MATATVVWDGREGQQVAYAHRSRQDAELFALRQFGRALSGVTFHEQPSSHARAWRSTASAYGGTWVDGAPETYDPAAFALRRRLVREIERQHEGWKFALKYANPERTCVGACEACALIAEAKC